MLFMNANGTVKSEQKIANVTGNFTTFLDTGDSFGEDVANIGDFDGDGVTDIVVGANDDDDGGTDRGAIYMLLMNSDGTVKSEQKISDTEGSFTGTLADSDFLVHLLLA